MANTPITEQLMDAPRFEQPWNRGATLALILLVAGMLVSLAWSVHPWYDAGDETNDAAIYIASARSMNAGQGYAYVGQPFTVRPPGMSAMIAPILAARGNDFHALNLLVSLFGVACVALLYVFARARVGTWLACLLAGIVWTNGEFQLLCNQVMSDVPGVALLFACCLLERWSSRKPSWKRDIVLGVCIGASTYIRSVIVLLLPAIVVARLAQRLLGRAPNDARPSWKAFVLRSIVPVVLCAFVVKLPWDVRCALHHPTPPVDQNFLYSYSTAMWHVDGGDPSSPSRPLSAILERIPERVPLVTSLIGTRLGSSSDSIGSAVGIVMVLATAWIAWRRRAPAEIFALGAGFVLLVYFGFRDRLVLPILLVALVATVEALQLVLARYMTRAVAVVALTPLLAWALFVGGRWQAGWSEIRARHEFFASTAAAVKREIQPDETVASMVGWHWSVYLERPVVSLFFAVRRAGEESGIHAMIEKYRVDRILLWPRIPSERGMIEPFRQRFGSPVSAGEALLFRARR